MDFAHDVHDLMMKDMDDPENYFPQVAYLIVSGGSMTAAIVGLVFLFTSYSDCEIGMFFTW